MLIFLNLPAKIVRLFDSNYSSSEVAAGVCMGMFMGFLPMNSAITVPLFTCFFIFRINRLSAMIVLPVFKLIYSMGFYKIADAAGGAILINADFLSQFWRFVTHFPVLALMELNNTLVSGGLAICFIFTAPLYFGSKKFIEFGRAKFFNKFKNSKFVIWFKKIPIINKILPFIAKVRRNG
jgi:uncharacterized protein (TIGR03546 family)